MQSEVASELAVSYHCSRALICQESRRYGWVAFPEGMAVIFVHQRAEPRSQGRFPDRNRMRAHPDSSLPRIFSRRKA
jgi:hypothetical protein